MRAKESSKSWSDVDVNAGECGGYFSRCGVDGRHEEAFFDVGGDGGRCGVSIPGVKGSGPHGIVRGLSIGAGSSGAWRRVGLRLEWGRVRAWSEGAPGSLSRCHFYVSRRRG